LEDGESDFRGPILRKAVGVHRGFLSRPENQASSALPNEECRFQLPFFKFNDGLQRVYFLNESDYLSP
jgi:hypothetical protein